MTAVPAPLHPQLLQALHRPHEAASAALADGQADSLAAVTWVATHLGAVSRVLHPVLARRLPEGGLRVKVLADVDRQLQRALWQLDRRLTGDVHGATREVRALEGTVAAALQQHARQEGAAVDELVQQLTGQEQVELAERLEHAVKHAPTRPHPDAPVRGPVAGIAYRIDAGADHLRDLMDNRDVPSPHDVPLPLVPGRWGSYVMGRHFPGDKS
jgi:hypothetical protein